MTTPEPGRTWAHQIVRTCPTAVTAGRPGGRQTRPSTVLLQWNPGDPAAVLLALADPWADGAIQDWTVGRNLLTAAVLPGLAGELVGRGDVQVRYDCGAITLTLFPEDARVAVQVAGELVIGFLRECAAVIPLGSLEESAIYGVAIDREYAALIAGSSS